MDMENVRMENVFVMLDTVDQTVRFKVDFIPKGCVNYILFFAFLEPKCPENCNGNGICQNGKCNCNDGYSGVSCEEAVRVMVSPCNDHGTLDIFTGECHCFKGYEGPHCQSTVKCK